jgi:hypothetical protein
VNASNEHIDRAIEQVYRGPLEDFVGRRNAAATEMRTSGDRQSAAALKSLKKPSRTAWALNLGATESPNLMQALAATIPETAAAPSSGVDVRASISAVRTAVQEFAVEAARLAGAAGHDLDAGVLAKALFAVLGETDSFSLLRRGRLAEIPTGGGLDLLSLLPTRADDPRPASPPPPQRPRSRTGSPAPADVIERDARQAEARAQTEKAAAELASAKERAAEAAAGLRDAEARVKVAEERLREADEDVREAKSRRDRALQEAEAAAEAVATVKAADSG